MTSWMYYNHAVIPTTAPHEMPNLACVHDGSIWKIKDGATPILVRWTSDFDCGYETNWWYLVKDAPFKLEDISTKERKSIRQALRKCYVKRIQPVEYLDALYDCYLSAFSRYENADNLQTKEHFMQSWQNNAMDCWCGFDAETDKLIGYMTVQVYEVYAEIKTAKFNSEFLNKQVSDALYYHVLEYYLNSCNKKYICSGSRSINHKTNTQEYKIRRFGYRKAYCHLHIVYNPKYRIFVEILYKFRKLLKKFDKITFFHQVNAVLLMEEIHRSRP